MVFGPLLSNGRQRVGAFKNASVLISLACRGLRVGPSKLRKIRAPIKIKSALPPPPKPKIPPPLKRAILWTRVFPAKGRIFPGVHKIGAPISGPRIADTNFTDTGILLISTHFTRFGVSRCPSTVSRTVWIRKRANSQRISLVSPTQKERKHVFVRVQIEYGFGCFQVRFGLVVSTVWIGSEYGFVTLVGESASESHTQNSTRTAPTSQGLVYTIGAKMITCRKNCFEQLILNYIALPYICYRLPGLISGCNVMVSLSCVRRGEPQGNLFTLHYPTGGSQRIN